MIGVPTMDAFELVSLSTSFVPLSTSWTSLRGFPRIFPFQPNPKFLALLLQTCGIDSVEPMRQPPIELPRKLSTGVRTNVLQILYGKSLNTTQIKGFKGMEHHALCFCFRMFLSLIERLNPSVNLSSNKLPVRSDQPVLVIRVKPKGLPSPPEFGSRLFQDDIHEQPVLTPPQTKGVSYRPPSLKLLIQMLGRLARDDHRGCSRAAKLEGESERALERNSLKGLNGNEVREQGDKVLMKIGFMERHSRTNLLSQRPDGFFRLFSQGLRETSGKVKPLTTSMDRREVRKVRSKIPTFPEEVNEILSGIMTEMKEGGKLLCLSGVDLVEVHPGRSPHRRNPVLSMRLDHREKPFWRDLTSLISYYCTQNETDFKD